VSDASVADPTIPIVFEDVDGDGVPKSLNYYRSANERVE
jgi:hypothetical protein